MKYKYKNYKVCNIEVVPSDVFNLDATLAPAIHALMKEYRRQPSSVGYIYAEDVPEHLLEQYNVSADEHSHGYCEAVWLWMLDEIIWATDPDWDDKNDSFNLEGKCDYEAHKKSQQRRNKAMAMFGKYYFSFWN